MFLETVSNPTNKEMNSFKTETPYPSVITRIYSDSVEGNDCNVTFVFLVFNGYTMKEIRHTCTNVFTIGRQHFKEFCEALLFDSDMNEYGIGEAIWRNYEEFFDLNELVGLSLVLHVEEVNHHTDVQKIYQCYFSSDEEYLGWDFETIFDNATGEDDFKPEISDEINDLLHELFNDDTLKHEFIFVDDDYLPIPFI